MTEKPSSHESITANNIDWIKNNSNSNDKTLKLPLLANLKFQFNCFLLHGSVGLANLPFMASAVEDDLSSVLL